MKVVIEALSDYPVITVSELPDPEQQDQPDTDERAQERRRRLPPHQRAVQEVEMDDALLERYRAARAEWVAVQQTLSEQYGDGVAVRGRQAHAAGQVRIGVGSGESAAGLGLDAVVVGTGRMTEDGQV